MSYVRRVKVYSFEKTDESKNKTDGSMDGAMIFACELANPKDVSIDSLDDQIKFLKKLKIPLGPRRMYIIESFETEDEWEEFDYEMIEYLKGEARETPTYPDETVFMLPFDYKEG